MIHCFSWLSPRRIYGNSPEPFPRNVPRAQLPALHRKYTQTDPVAAYALGCIVGDYSIQEAAAQAAIGLDLVGIKEPLFLEAITPMQRMVLVSRLLAAISLAWIAHSRCPWQRAYQLKVSTSLGATLLLIVPSNYGPNCPHEPNKGWALAMSALVSRGDLTPVKVLKSFPTHLSAQGVTTKGGWGGCDRCIPEFSHSLTKVARICEQMIRNPPRLDSLT